jgi:deoxyhypusine synthase
VVCYTDSTIAMPLLAAYALERHKPRQPKRLFKRRQEMLDRLVGEYAASSRNEAAQSKARSEHTPTLERDR